MDIAEASRCAIEIRRFYARYEQKLYGRSQQPQDVAVGFVGDVGDLLKLVQAQEGIRNIPDAKDKLAHALADCLQSVLLLAELYDINIEEAFAKTMDEIEEIVSAKI